MKKSIAHFFSSIVIILLVNVFPVCAQSGSAGPSQRELVEFLVIVSLFVMGLHNIVIYAMRPSDRAPMWFGFFCFLMSINLLISAGGFIAWFFPGLPFYISNRIDIVTMMLAIPSIVLFLNLFFPSERKQFIVQFIVIVSVCTAIAAASVPYPLCIVLFKIYFGVIFLGIVYSIFLSMSAWCKNKIDSSGIIFGIILMSATGINDLLWGFGFKQTIILTPYATVLFALVYSALLSRRFAHAFSSAEKLAHQILENQRLRGEMQRRIDQEQDLHLTQRRLTALLHVIEDPLCVVNENSEITFCNRAFEELSGCKLDSIVTKPASEVVESNLKTHQAETMALELEDEQLSVMIFKNRNTDTAQTLPAFTFIEALNKNRQRIQRLEELLESTSHQSVQTNPQLAHELSMIDSALQHMGQVLSGEENSEEKKKLGSKVLNLAIEYWSESTGKSKFDLASESRLWKVQVNQDGWERTQTLDRYLSPKTFPKNPRWNYLLKTADFVLATCSENSSLRKDLEKHLQQLMLVS